MTRIHHPLELLAPAKNADFGIEAIKHGADAVYIGGPSFGARYGAGNSVEDIARLAAFAHRYHAKVFVALNTILRDDELEDSRQLAWQLYDAGADALIIQDMGLLEIDLPPIQLHASTQTDNRNPDKVKFLEDAGFSQVVLARELSLNEIIKISSQSSVALEYFVHGALCVAYSGQCFISHAHTGRSANRGECSQACRLPYTLIDDKGKTITENQHLLSMKDNNQSENILALAKAGVSSFKIEGRLKDLSYVKNITAHYRTLLDEVIASNPEFSRASSAAAAPTPSSRSRTKPTTGAIPITLPMTARTISARSTRQVLSANRLARSPKSAMAISRSTAQSTSTMATASVFMTATAKSSACASTGLTARRFSRSKSRPS